MDNKILLAIVVVMSFVLYGTIKTKMDKPSSTNTPASERPFSDDWTPSNTPINEPSSSQPPAEIIPLSAKNYVEAIEMSKKNNKPVVLFFSSKHCPPCLRMKKELAPSLAKIQDKLIWYEVDCNAEPALVRKFGIKVTPTYLVVNGQEEVLKRGEGYLSVKDFGAWLAKPYDKPQESEPLSSPPKQSPPPRQSPPPEQFSPG